MTEKYRTKGFVFKKDERGEYDQIFTAFTEDFGRLELKAKAIRKITSKLRASVDLFYFSEFEFIQGKNSKTLTDASKIKDCRNIIFSPDKVEVGQKIAMVLDGFIKGQERDAASFNLLKDFFDIPIINSPRVKSYQLAYQYFFWNFISLQGYKLEVDNCASCGTKLNPYTIYFSCKEGGVICRECSGADKKSEKINSDVVKILRIILNKDWDLLARLKAEPASINLFKSISDSAVLNFLPANV